MMLMAPRALLHRVLPQTFDLFKKKKIVVLKT